MQNRYIIQLRTDPAYDVIDVESGLVVSIWNSVEAAEIDRTQRTIMDRRDAQRAAREQREGRANPYCKVCGLIEAAHREFNMPHDFTPQ